MSEESSIDIEQELEELLTKVQPNLQDVIKRSFTNVALQLSSNGLNNGEQTKPDNLEDTSYFTKNTQVNLSRLELVKPPSFHVQNISVDVKSMAMTLRCSLGEVKIKGLYSAFNENLYNLIPVMSEGHVLISLLNMTADVQVGLTVDNDEFSCINPSIEFNHDEVLIKLSWPSPQRSGGYEFKSTEQVAKHMDELPLSACLSFSLRALLARRLRRHLDTALRRAASVSQLMRCDTALLDAYSARAHSLATFGNKAIDALLMDVRRSLLQARRELLPAPPLPAVFLHKVGATWCIGRFETDAGWVKNLATVDRVGDVSVTRPDELKTTFRATLSIKDLQIGYDSYHVRAAGAACAGRLAARCSSRLALRVTMGRTRWEPYAQLDELSLEVMDNTEVHAPGLGSLPWLAAAAAGWARAPAAAVITEQLRREVAVALARLPMWERTADSGGR
ncbi:uncharacterized protein LOC105382553 [Plutella xylostella]|uniref:uncharacterized protein LOC105382553 n=1 Tax=Plutella xylostella TaxID=51655 RepID=UPI0020324D82|nr:uncharacterized protein LOC105382553 [Plutella xylostella]